MDNKEDVRDSCSVLLCVKRFSAVAVLRPRVADEEVEAKSCARGFRECRVEDWTADSTCAS